MTRRWVILTFLVVVIIGIGMFAVSLHYIPLHPRLRGNGNGNKICVVVTILPEADFVRHVGGDRVKVIVMVPPGASPHTYEPVSYTHLTLPTN